jgi:hypothetical protein
MRAITFWILMAMLHWTVGQIDAFAPSKLLASRLFHQGLLTNFRLCYQLLGKYQIRQ